MPRALGLLGEEAAELRGRDDPVAVVPHRRRRRDAPRRPRGEQIDGLPVHRPVVRDVLHVQAVLEQPAQRTRVHDRAGEKVRARLLPFLDHGDRDVAEPLGDLGVRLEQLSQPDRAGEPPGPPPTIRTPTSIRSSAGDDGATTASLARERRRKSAGATPLRFCLHPLRARTSSVSLGRICSTSPITATSAKSKIGAFGSLLIATIVPEFCIPTLCWIAPEMPQAT